MLRELRVKNYKSLYNTQISFAPVTVLIGPNGSGKSNICESMLFLSKLVENIDALPGASHQISDGLLNNIANDVFRLPSAKSKYWHGDTRAQLQFDLKIDDGQTESNAKIVVPKEYFELPLDARVVDVMRNLRIYDFSPYAVGENIGAVKMMERSGRGIAYSLADILLNDRERFDELESRLVGLIPNVSGIVIERLEGTNEFRLFLKDAHSNYRIPSSEISDGTLRILAFLTALYQPGQGKIICFEEPENGVHPWLLSQLVQLANDATDGKIAKRKFQFVITTHSPILVNYLKPEQVRAVELDRDGKTLVHELPSDNLRFVKALEAFEGELGEMWFTDIYGANPG